MVQNELWLKTDLKKPIKIVSVEDEMFTRDSYGNLIGVNVYDDGEPVTLVGDVYGYIIRSDDATVMVEGTKSGNAASIVLPASAYNITGVITIIIKIIDGDTRTVIGACTGHVTSSMTDEIVDPDQIIPIESLPVSITSTNTYYQESESGSTVPTGTWLDTIPAVHPGLFLWQKIVFTWNNGDETVLYNNTRYGTDSDYTFFSALPTLTGLKTSLVYLLNQIGALSSRIVGFNCLFNDSGFVQYATYSGIFTITAEDSFVVIFTGSITVENDVIIPQVYVSYSDGDWNIRVLPNPSTALSLTAAAGSWTSATPPTQTITATGVTATNNIVVGIGSSATAEQIDAAAEAKILCTAQGLNEITLTCYGDEPSVNIPISVLIVG